MLVNLSDIILELIFLLRIRLELVGILISINKILEKFSWDKIIDAIGEIIDDIVKYQTEQKNSRKHHK